MKDSIRDSFIGQVIHRVSKGRYLQYIEDTPSFVIPEKYLLKPLSPSSVRTPISASSHPHPRTAHLREDTIASHASSTTLFDRSPDTLTKGKEGGKEGGKEKKEKEKKDRKGYEGEPIIVDWYGPNDPENPLNWPLTKKCWLTFCIILLTFSVYIGSSIWAPALYIGADYFQVSLVVSTLGIALFVLGYGLGPLFLAPITEIPAIGRTAPYIVTLFIYCMLQIPNALVDNFAGFAILRFLSGFVGSPVLATGGASVADIFYPEKVAYAMSLYGFAAAAGPGLGPIAVAWAIDAKGWRWAFWEMLWLSGFAIIFLSIVMPETNPETILHRRAVRLRRLTGNPNLRSEGEILQSHLKPREVLSEALLRPLIMTFTEPIILGVNLYIGLMYATIYTFFESFPMVFHYGYGWSIGVATLPFGGIMIGEAISFGLYCLWNRVAFEGKYVAARGKLLPEERLPLTVIGSAILPVAIFWFAWSANRAHWINPVLAAALFGVGIDFIFMPYFNYLPSAYPRYAASALASNDFVRSMMAAAMPVVSIPLFHNLGVDWGNTIIGGCAVLFVPLPILLIKYGPWLRERSPISVHQDEIDQGTEWEKYHGKNSSSPIGVDEEIGGEAVADGDVRAEWGGVGEILSGRERKGFGSSPLSSRG